MAALTVGQKVAWKADRKADLWAVWKVELMADCWVGLTVDRLVVAMVGRSAVQKGRHLVHQSARMMVDRKAAMMEEKTVESSA